MNSYHLTYEQWPYAGIPQEKCGPRSVTVDLQTTEFQHACEKTALIICAAENNEVVWVCKVVKLELKW